MLQYLGLLSGWNVHEPKTFLWFHTQFELHRCLNSLHSIERIEVVTLKSAIYRFMVFNTTFNKISGISWWSVLLVEESGLPRENHRPVASHITLYRLHLAWAGFELTTLVVIWTDCTGSWKSNYHTTTTAIYNIYSRSVHISCTSNEHNISATARKTIHVLQILFIYINRIWKRKFLNILTQKDLKSCNY